MPRTRTTTPSRSVIPSTRGYDWSRRNRIPSFSGTAGKPLGTKGDVRRSRSRSPNRSSGLRSFDRGKSTRSNVDRVGARRSVGNNGRGSATFSGPAGRRSFNRGSRPNGSSFASPPASGFRPLTPEGTARGDDRGRGGNRGGRRGGRRGGHRGHDRHRSNYSWAFAFYTGISNLSLGYGSYGYGFYYGAYGRPWSYGWGGYRNRFAFTRPYCWYGYPRWHPYGRYGGYGLNLRVGRRLNIGFGYNYAPCDYGYGWGYGYRYPTYRIHRYYPYHYYSTVSYYPAYHPVYHGGWYATDTVDLNDPYVDYVDDEVVVDARNRAPALPEPFLKPFTTEFPEGLSAVETLSKGEEWLAGGESLLAAEAFRRAWLAEPADYFPPLQLSLALFALGSYDLGGYAVSEGLARNQAWLTRELDVSGKFGAGATFAGHLINLQKHVLKHPDAAEARFLLAYLNYCSGRVFEAHRELSYLAEKGWENPLVQPFIKEASTRLLGPDAKPEEGADAKK